MRRRAAAGSGMAAVLAAATMSVSGQGGAPALVITAECPWLAEMNPDLSPVLGVVGEPYPPPPHPLIVIVAPLSIARSESRVNSRRSRVGSCMASEEQGACPRAADRVRGIRRGGAPGLLRRG